MSLRWVCYLKETNAGFVPKTQLVVKGFEDNEKKNNVPTESPNCFKEKFLFLESFIYSFINKIGN